MYFAIVGENTQRSLSPRMHKWIYDVLHLEHQYDSIDINKNNVNNIVNKLRNGVLHGINITIPYKKYFINYLDEIDSCASKIGAINCILSNNGFLEGYNTDYFGFEKLISINNIKLKNKNILILGAGGASSAICSYLANNKHHFSIFNRSHSNAQLIIDRIDYSSHATIVQSPLFEHNYDIIINCLPSYINMSNLLESAGYNFRLLDYLIDINYDRSNIISSKVEAQVRINGLDMLIYQGIRSNEIWLQKTLEKRINYSKLYNYLLED